MKCECGAEIIKERDLKNERIAQLAKIDKLDMCEECWENYCHHALTGE